MIDITPSLFGMTVYDRLEPLQRFVNPMSRENYAYYKKSFFLINIIKRFYGTLSNTDCLVFADTMRTIIKTL